MIIIQAGKNISKQYASVLRTPSSSHILSIQLIQRYRSTEEQKQPPTTEKCSDPPKPPATHSCSDTPKPPAKDTCSKPPKEPPRNRCEEPPKCEEKPLSRKLFTLAGMALVGTSIAVYSAKHDDDFRDWTREKLPALDNLTKVIYQEDETYGEFILDLHKEATQGLKDALFSLALGIKNAGKKKREPVIEQPVEIKKPKEVFKYPNSAFVIEDESSKSKVPENLKHLKEQEDNMFKDAQDAMQAYNAVTNALREKAKFIQNLDQMVSKHDCKLWDRIKKINQDLTGAIDKSKESLEKIQFTVEDQKSLKEKFDDSVKKVKESAEYLRFQMDRTPNLPLDVKEKAENNIKYTEDVINKAKETLDEDINNQTYSRLPHDKMRLARMYFYDQLETFFPNVNLNAEKLSLPVESMEPFIDSVIQNINVAEKDLKKFQTVVDAEVKNAIEIAQKSELDKKDKDTIVDVFAKIESEKEKRLQREELQKAIHANKARCDKTNKESLKKLTEVYRDLKEDAEAARERELGRKYEQILGKVLADQRFKHQLAIAGMVARIQGANEAIASLGKTDKGQLEKQKFWSAAQNLHSSVKPIGTSASNEIKPLKNEVLNVTKAAPDGDKLVKSVVDSIPSEVIEQGVVSEECLKKRFLKVEKEARHLASVPSGKVTLIQLALARIQSALYVDLPISEKELNNEPINVEKLNNYEILQRARYYVNHGHLDQAVKYLNLLKGPSSVVASCWAKDVVKYMETVQAAEVLLAYASSFPSQ